MMAYDLAMSLCVTRKECCIHKTKYAVKYEAIDCPDWDVYLKDLHFIAEHPDLDRSAHEDEMRKMTETLTENQIKDLKVSQELQAVWWHKFNEIRECPNERQCVKFDRISDILKRFFMERSNERDIKTGKRKWIISFEEILTVYPNVEELHFMNEYRFDDGVLQRLIKQIEREDNTLRKVVFLYFDYTECGDGSGKPMESSTFR